MSALRPFLCALFEGCDGMLELRALPSAARKFVPPSAMAAVTRFVQNHRAEDLYYGVALRRSPQAGRAPRGALVDCVALPALFTDLDFKVTTPDQAREAFRSHPLTPSAVVRSGGGLHWYWLLKEPMELPAEAQRARNLLRRIARQFRGDLSAAEPARILRIPGTLNHKYDPSRPVVLALLDSARRFNPSDFDFLPPEPATTADGAPRFALPERIRSGNRNPTLYRLARSLKGRGLGEQEILTTLTSVNEQRCDPPLNERELRELARHAAMQMDRPRNSQIEIL